MIGIDFHSNNSGPDEYFVVGLFYCLEQEAIAQLTSGERSHRSAVISLTSNASSDNELPCEQSLHPSTDTDGWIILSVSNLADAYPQPS